MPGCLLAFPFETVRVKWPPDPLCAYTSGRTPTPSPLPGCIGPLVPALYCTGLLDSGPRAPCASSSGRLHARTDAYSLATESAAARPVVGRPCLPCRRTGPLHSTRLQADFHTIAAAWPAAGRQRLPCCCSGPYHWPLNSGPRVPCTLRTTAYTSGRFHRRRRVGCRPARGRPPAPPPPLCPASSTSDLECAPCGGCPSSLSSSDLVRPHRRLFTYAPGPPHGVVLLLLRMAARAFLAAAPAPSTPDLACLRWRFSFPRSRAYHGRSCTHPPLLPTFHGPSARAALHLSFSLHHVLLCFRGLVTLVLTRACPC